MPSSIFASKLGANRAIFLVVMGLFSYFCALEVMTRAEFIRISSIQRRIHDDQTVAIHLRPTESDGRETVLLTGNSLLLLGVDSSKLRHEMLPGYLVHVLPIENTQYVDWYFGTRRLFAEGSRPAFLVLCLSPRQLIAGGTAGEYFAHYMMRGRDVLLVKKEAGLSMTMTSDFFFAHLSSWLGSRSEIRNWLLEELMPNIENLTLYLPEKAVPMPPSDIVIREGLPRLQAMQQLCTNHGTQFVFLIPPSLEPDQNAAIISAAAARIGITVLLPYQGGELPADDFRDGFHLNPRGAALFTERLGPALARTMSKN